MDANLYYAACHLTRTLDWSRNRDETMENSRTGPNKNPTCFIANGIPEEGRFHPTRGPNGNSVKDGWVRDKSSPTPTLQ